ncbi:MAG: DUF996 domain-containing protein [Candidatus Bathyarchaeota archaeon]|nr:DUF996 domain-containing protein [Candidatus Bathyarchaeota archaeon]MDW8040509.1 DUF996 domain-containing protein [Nitrososphaerota archaeon]
MSFESNRILGGIGALLMVISALGVLTWAYLLFLLLVGAILVLIALKGFADHYQDGGIFNNALYGFISVIVGLVTTIAVFMMLVLQVLATIEVDWTNPMEIQQYFMNNMNVVWQIAGTAIGAFLVFYISVVLSAVLFRKALDTLSTRSGEKMFGTAGMVLLIGALLTVVLIGLIVIWISWILLAVGFFSIKAAQPPTQPATVQPPPQPSSS